MSPGAFVRLNTDDDEPNGQQDILDSPSVNEDDLAPMALSVKPDDLDGAVTLDATAGKFRIKVWPDETKTDSEVTLPPKPPWTPGSTPPGRYLEGCATSANLRDVTLVLQYTGHGLTVSDTVKVTVVTLQLKTVSFGGPTYRVVRKDGSLDPEDDYDAPHWQDADGVGGPERHYPVAYTSVPFQVGQDTALAHMEVAVEITAGPASAFTPCTIRAVGTDDYSFEGAGALDGNVLSFAAGDVECEKDFAEHTVGLIDELELDWRVLVDGATWVSAGKSKDRVYVAWQEPTASPLFETLLWLSCKGADGFGGPDAAAKAPEVVAKIWGEFTDGHNGPACVQRVDTLQLLYWWTDEETMAKSLPELLSVWHGDGSCVAWSELLNGCMKAQGFTSKPAGAPTGDLDILEICRVTPNTTLNPGAVGFAVKNWSFDEPPSFPGTYYPYLVDREGQPGDAHEETGIPGQGNPDPPCRFQYHYVCRIKSAIYDPSYGIGGADEQAHENALIDAIAAFIYPNDRCRKNDRQLQELVYTREPSHEQ